MGKFKLLREEIYDIVFFILILIASFKKDLDLTRNIILIFIVSQLLYLKYKK